MQKKNIFRKLTAITLVLTMFVSGIGFVFAHDELGTATGGDNTDSLNYFLGSFVLESDGTTGAADITAHDTGIADTLMLTLQLQKRSKSSSTWVNDTQSFTVLDVHHTIINAIHDFTNLNTSNYYYRVKAIYHCEHGSISLNSNAYYYLSL